ncbi:MAG: mechanosensitive ion channel family protein [Phormidesmis sp.]
MSFRLLPLGKLKYWLAALSAALLWALPGLAQIPPNSLVPGNASSLDATPAPANSSEGLSATSRLLPEQWTIMPESIAAAPIYLDGRTLFWVSAPTVVGQWPAEERAQEIQQRLYTLARSDSSPEVTVETDEPSNLPVIFINDQPLLTVTALDARLSGHANPDNRAEALAETLRTAFSRYQREREPGFWQRQARIGVIIVVIASLLQIAVRRIGRKLQQRQVRLANAQTQLGQARSGSYPMVEASPMSLNTVLEQLKARLDNHQKRKINEVERGLLVLFQLGLWISSLLWILALFPYSRWLSTLLLQWMKIPAKILLIVGLASLTVRISSLVIDKVSLALQEGTRWAPDKSQRLNLRFSTFSQVAKGLVGAIIFGVTVLVALAIAGVQIGPVLAGAGIIGVGISLASQSLIKDFINGFLILAEDHFGIGDVITVQELTGAVEHVNLRITQLRDIEGRLITIPNSQISIVQNLSKDWAQVDFSVSVATTTDLNKALSLLKETASELAEDVQWQPLILEPPEVLGVDKVDHTGINLRLLLKTQPLKQWPVAFELRQRIKQSFDQAGIAIGVPQEQLELRWKKRADTNGGQTAAVQLRAEEVTQSDSAH